MSQLNKVSHLIQHQSILRRLNQIRMEQEAIIKECMVLSEELNNNSDYDEEQTQTLMEMTHKETELYEKRLALEHYSTIAHHIYEPTGHP